MSNALKTIKHGSEKLSNEDARSRLLKTPVRRADLSPERALAWARQEAQRQRKEGPPPGKLPPVFPTVQTKQCAPARPYKPLREQLIEQGLLKAKG